MSRLLPCKRSEFVRKLKALGYAGPYSGGDHEFMAAPGRRPVKVPNPHGSEISVDLLSKVLKAANIDRDRWIAA